MKYFIQVEGNEKLFIKAILVFLLVIIFLLSYIALRTPEIFIDDNHLQSLCLK